jgi:hypothetical protein
MDVCLTTPIGASAQNRVGIFPIGWSWYITALVIGAGVTVTRNQLFIDCLNNHLDFNQPFDFSVSQPVIGFEEAFSIRVTSAGALASTLRRQFSMDQGLTWFTIVDTVLAVNATTSSIQAVTLNRFPAYPLFRYQLINTDGVNAVTLNGVLTLRSR